MSQSTEPDQVRAANPPGLTSAEDQELRQLIWFCRAGSISDQATGRLVELLGRDRRIEVRHPRPNPSAGPEDDPSTTLPPLQWDRYATLTCQNCGSVMPLPDRAY